MDGKKIKKRLNSDTVDFLFITGIIMIIDIIFSLCGAFVWKNNLVIIISNVTCVIAVVVILSQMALANYDITFKREEVNNGRL